MRFLDRLAAVGAFLVLTFVLVSVLSMGEDVTDSAYFNYVGRCLNAGRRLYVDIWDCKGPILYWMSAVGVWINPHWGFWVFFACFWAADLLLLHALAKRMGPFPGLVVFLFSIISFGCGTDRYLVIGRQEALGLFFILSALNLDRIAGRRRVCDLAVGLCCGLAFMVKPTFAAFGSFLLVRWLSECRGGRQNGEFWCRLGCVVFGGILGLTACTLAYWPGHVADFWNGALLWNLMERVGTSPTRHWMVRLCKGGAFVAHHGWTMLVLLALAVPALFGTLRRGWRGAPMTCWIVIELSLLIVISEFYGYYAMIGLLPVVLSLFSTLSPRRFLICACLTASVFIGVNFTRTLDFFATADARRTELSALRTLMRNRTGTIAVCGGNFSSDVMNRLHLFSSQKYTYWNSWGKRSKVDGRVMMQDEFRRTLDNHRCEFLLTHGKKERLLMHGVPESILQPFRLVYMAPNFQVRLYRRTGGIAW